MIRPVLSAVALACATIASGADVPDPITPEAADYFETSIRPVLVESCESCHHPEDDENVVRFLDALTRADLSRDRHLWSSVAEQLRNRTMPPADEPQPDEGDRMRVADWIDTTLRQTACDGGPFAGQAVARRLNRVEYENTIRDLFGLTLGYDDLLPTDGSGGEGFDNNGETLYLPPMLMERYVEASQNILNQAIVSPPVRRTFAASQLHPPHAGKDRVLGNGDEATAIFSIYEVGPVEAAVTLASAPAAGAKLVLKVDGLAVKRVAASELTDDGVLRVSSRLSRGMHAVAIRNAGPDPIRIRSIAINQKRKEPADWEIRKHRRLLGLDPGTTPDDVRGHAKERLARLMRRAYRRPVADEDVERLVSLFDFAIKRGDPWEEATKLAMQPVLLSPHFLFRRDLAPDQTGQSVELIDQYALASRLSFFLTMAPPDDELLTLAEAGRLHDSSVLREQVDRLLASDRSGSFDEHFVGQWLGTREVGGRIVPDTGTFAGDYTAHLLRSFRLEPVMLFRHVRRNDRPLLELLTADYGLLNHHLKEHYGLIKDREPERRWKNKQDDPADEDWTLVKFPGGRRGGLLGMGGVHLATSRPNRTSPVLRGAWVLETLLGIHVPNPPPDVPSLKPAKGKPQSVREQLTTHREDPACAACHNLMDPVGFALDNYDVLGRYREKEAIRLGKKVVNTIPIDATATLPDGTAFEGLPGLKAVLVGKKRKLKRHLVRRMLGFALGRSLTDRDDCTIDRITDAIVDDEATIRDLVHEVVQSVPFRYRQTSDPDAVAATPR